MKICMISKYPPIEGGVSSKTYWLAKALGEAGHKIFVISNCWEVEDEYREVIPNEELDKLEPKNVHLFSTGGIERFIPYFNPYDAKLASLAIDVIRKYDPDIIYSHYLLPYGVSAFVAKLVTKKPLIVRHAGTDITKLFNSPFLKTIFIEIFKNADIIIAPNYTLLSNFVDPKKCVSLHDIVNEKEFHPNVEPFDLSQYKKVNSPIFTYIGKLNDMKKYSLFIEAASNVNGDFTILFVTEKGKRLKELQWLVRNKGLEEKTIFLPFQPPWRIPSILTASTCVVCPESHETPFLPKGTHFPIKAIEAMLCGRCTIIGEGVYEKYKNRYNIQNGVSTIVINPENTHEFAEKMEYIIKNTDITDSIGKNARKAVEKDFDKYVESFINICRAIT